MTVEPGAQLGSTESGTDGTQTPPEGEDAPTPNRQVARPNRRRWVRRCLARWRSIVATVLVVAAVGVAAGLFFTLYRPDQRIDDAAAHQAIQAASGGAVDLLSYSYASLDSDFDKAKSHLTGEFLDYYGKFTQQLVAPVAREGQLTATAKVIRAALSDLQPKSAVVLVFVDQTTVGTQKPQPVKADSSVLVSLTKVNGSWLIAKFDPVG